MLYGVIMIWYRYCSNDIHCILVAVSSSLDHDQLQDQSTSTEKLVNYGCDDYS